MAKVIKDKITQLIKLALEEIGLSETVFTVEHPTDMRMGDYSTNVGIKTGQADKITAILRDNLPEEIEKVENVGIGFINFYLSRKFFFHSLKEIIEKGDKFGISDYAKGQKIMVEHSQPNPFKDFHIGHLMNNAIGEAISRILRWNSAEVKTASYHGDVGLHVAKAVWGKMKRPELSWGEAYAFGDENYEENKKEIADLNWKIYERSDEKINSLYDSGKKESLAHFANMYARLGSEFHFHYFESESGVIGKELVLKNLGRVFERSNGAIVFVGENFEPKTHTRVFLNKDGLPTYEAKELGLVKMKKESWDFDLSITITAKEQDAFFNVVEVVVGEIFPELRGKLKHLSHGMLKLATGKMSSRAGNVVVADEFIETVKDKTRGKEEVAIGAIKYMILRQAIGSDIVFDIDKSVSTEGDSGVYLQYAHARASSILEKARAADLQHYNDPVSFQNREIHEVERLLYRFPEIVERAGMEYAPHYLVTYLTELAASFNNFYAREPVLTESPEAPYRLAVVKAFKCVMGNGLFVLGIPAPERI